MGNPGEFNQKDLEELKERCEVGGFMDNILPSCKK